MALFKSQILTQASGSVGGTTFSHSKGGMYMRARSMPVNPNTALQGLARAALTGAVTNWTSVLTPTQRAQWELYAANVPVTNKLGDSVNLSGQNMYVRTQQVMQNAIARGIGSTTGPFSNAPSIFNLGEFTTPTTPTADAVSGFEMLFTNTDEWANDDLGAMYVYQGRPINGSRNYFRGPWRLVGSILGDSMTPPTSPFTITAANLATRGYPLVADQLVYWEVQVIQADGRLSTRRRLPATVVTP